MIDSHEQADWEPQTRWLTATNKMIDSHEQDD